MEAFYKDPHVDIYQGDCREVLAYLPAESVQCVVTSPPYWGLRKYSGEQELVWGDDHCEHEWGVIAKAFHPGQVPDGKWVANVGVAEAGRASAGDVCYRCGAWRGQYGLEPSPEMYVQHTIEFLRAIRRVLRKDGVVFWNIGDSYGSGKGTCFNPGGGKGSFSGHGDRKDAGAYPLDRGNVSLLKASGLKPKDLCLIPFRVAIAAQSDGWWVRSIIIWSKPNPMPESVKDRPTESHEYILLLTKSATYYWDQEAVREAYTKPMNRWGGDILKRDTSKTAAYKEMQHIGYSSAFRVGRPMRPNEAGRNLRSVWEFPTQPYPKAHFAVFPSELPKRCILAATSERGNCPKCGRPWERLTEQKNTMRTLARGSIGLGTQDIKEMTGKGASSAGYIQTETLGWRPQCGCIDEWKRRCGADSKGEYHGQATKDYAQAGAQNPSDVKRRILAGMDRRGTTTGWEQSCDCPQELEPAPAIVLDPFAGSGTVGEVAKSLGRKAILIEIGEDYCRLAQQRVQRVSLPLASPNQS